MPFTPRKSEVDAVVGLLESEDFDSPAALARAIVKQVAVQLTERPWFAVAHRFTDGDQGINFGIFPGRPDAEKFRDRLDGETGVVMLHPPVLTEPEPAGVCRCGHAKELHQLGACAVILRAPRIESKPYTLSKEPRRKAWTCGCETYQEKR